jgi:hypothetical protein
MDACVTKTPVQYEALREAEDDLTLVHAAKEGDISAFDKLIRRYDRKLLRIAQSVTHNRVASQGSCRCN